MMCSDVTLMSELFRCVVRMANCSSTHYVSSEFCASASIGSVTCRVRSQSTLTPSVTSSRILPKTSDFCRQTRPVIIVVMFHPTTSAVAVHTVQ